ncbi:MAG: hypothetical protein AMS22_15470, partial [Thiotrichales bacterium SG8_50]
MALVASVGAFSAQPANAICAGRLANPITDFCWSCFFPLSIGGVSMGGMYPDAPGYNFPVCLCPGGPFLLRVGLSLGWWEPGYLADFTRTPFCMTGLGINLDPGLGFVPKGGRPMNDAKQVGS